MMHAAARICLGHCRSPPAKCPAQLRAVLPCHAGLGKTRGGSSVSDPKCCLPAMEEGSHCDQYITDGLVGLLVPSLEPVRSGAVWGTWAGMNLGASAGAVSLCPL